MEINLQDLKDELGRRTFDGFVEVVSDNEITRFHSTYYRILDLFAWQIIKRLIITVPPQHGKSDGSTRYLPSFCFGINPDKRIAIGSYSDPFAQKFNRDIQRIIDTPDYMRLFPETHLNGSRVVNTSSYLRNSHEFELVNKKGSLKAVGRGGGLTGNPVDIMIMDDLYKDAMEGNSPAIRAKVLEWYKSVVKKRLHNDSQELIVFTRWHEDDLIGWLEENDTVVICNSFQEIFDALARDKNAWIKINFEALKESEPSEFDPREQGEALWEARHSREKNEAERRLDPLGFDCMNQGNPLSKEGLMYGDFKTYSRLPVKPLSISSYTDTADTGDNYLCGIDYFEYNGLFYVLDVLYTQDKQEITEISLADMYIRNKTNFAGIESNNGGRAFARNVERICKEKGHNSTYFQWIPQRDNKQSRILTNVSNVMNNVIFPDNWMHRWPVFYKHLIKFRADFSSKYDDAPDVVTAIVEKRTKTIPIIY